MRSSSPAFQYPFLPIAHGETAVRDHGQGRERIAAPVILQIRHSPFFITAYKEADVVLHHKLQIPYAPHHIQHGYSRPFVILRPSANEIAVLYHRLKRLVFPSFAQRHHIQMVPQAYGILPVLYLPADSPHIVLLIFRIKSILPSYSAL